VSCQTIPIIGRHFGQAASLCADRYRDRSECVRFAIQHNEADYSYVRIDLQILIDVDTIPQRLLALSSGVTRTELTNCGILVATGMSTGYRRVVCCVLVALERQREVVGVGAMDTE